MKNGRYYPRALREHVFDMNQSGLSQRTIAKELKTSRRFAKMF